MTCDHHEFVNSPWCIHCGAHLFEVLRLIVVCMAFAQFEEDHLGVVRDNAPQPGFRC